MIEQLPNWVWIIIILAIPISTIMSAYTMLKYFDKKNNKKDDKD